jgi:flagellar biosynthetic protein FliS
MKNLTLKDVADYYFREQIETASKKKAIYLLHEQCLFFILKTQSINKQKNHIFLTKAQNIITQLQLSLQIYDSISLSLFYLYNYCYFCLERGNNQDIRNAYEIFGILRDVFRKLLKNP